MQSAMSQAVGGNFGAVGRLECALLLQYGLDRSDTVIDVGCGSGRLGFQLRNRLDGRYVGIDVVRDLFEQDLADRRPDKVLNQFLSRDALEAWAAHLGLEIVDFHDGDKPHIRLEDVVRWDDGREMSGHGSLGQSVCVLTRP